MPINHKVESQFCTRRGIASIYFRKLLHWEFRVHPGGSLECLFEWKSNFAEILSNL